MYEFAGLGEHFGSLFLQMCKSAGLVECGSLFDAPPQYFPPF
jgi:hypothetical protein